jgi:hypothetical protein
VKKLFTILLAMGVLAFALGFGAVGCTKTSSASGGTTGK